MRVLHIVTHMNRGGLETMIMNYYRQMDRSVVQFDFLVHRQERADYDDEIESLGGKIYRLSMLNPFSKSYLKELHDFFKSHEEYQVVHCHLDCMSAIPLKAAREAGIPVRIAHSHNTNQDHNLKYLLKLHYKKQIPGQATDLFACSEAAGAWTFEGNPFKVFPNAINAKEYIYDDSKRKRFRAELNIRDELVIGHVGRFNPQKNHAGLIDIFEKIHESVPTAKLMLIGIGEGMDEIRAKVNRLGLEEFVMFMGLRSDVAELLQVMDVFVMPSLYEGLPVTIIEAQAAGLPCLISDKVPIECKKTELVQQLPLAGKPENWAEVAVQMAMDTERRDTSEDIRKSGFDVVENAKWLQEFYLSKKSY